MKNILITGASGFLGYNLCCDLQDRYRIHATRHDTEPEARVVSLVRMDLGGSLKPLDEYISQHDIQAIIHCAALSKVGPCAADPALAKRLNVDGTRGLAGIAADHRISFIFISTDLVYNSGPGPHAEDDADPHMAYSESKFDAEIEVFMACPSAIVLRCALIFGADDGQHGSFLRENQRDLDQGKILKLFTDQIRSPVWSRDIADAIHRILSQGLRSRIYNVGGSTSINRYDLGLMAAKIFQWNDDLIIPVSMTGITSDADYLRDCSLDTSRLESDTGWGATPLTEAMTSVAGDWIVDG